MWAGLIAIRGRVACCCVNMAGPRGYSRTNYMYLGKTSHVLWFRGAEYVVQRVSLLLCGLSIGDGRS